VQTGGFPLPPAFDGSKLASLSSGQGLVGTLSAPTTVGATYVLSVRVLRVDAAAQPAVELRLRNSGSGAQSAAATQVSGTQVLTWALVTGTATANAGYDRVVLRQQTAGALFVDDVRVCKAAGSLQAGPTGWWTTARVVGAAVLGALLVGAGVAVRRRFRTRGRYSTATVRG
jgi:hypothetical protein